MHLDATLKNPTFIKSNFTSLAYLFEIKLCILSGAKIRIFNPIAVEGGGGKIEYLYKIFQRWLLGQIVLNKNPQRHIKDTE